MRIRAALLASIIAVALSAGASNATTTAALSLTLSTSSSYAHVSGTTLYYSTNAFTFTVKASDGTAPYTFEDVPGFTKTVSGSDTATYDGTPTGSSSDTWDVTDTTAATVKFTMTPDVAPTVSNLAPTEITGAGDQYWNSGANTLWFRPAGAGSFTLNATAASSRSGIGDVTFPDVSATSGWAGSTGGADTSASFASPVAYTWTAGAAAPGAKQVTATTRASLTASASITISADSVAPSGQTVALSGGPWYASASVPLTLGAGTDAGAGVDSSRGVVERALAPLTNGTCGTFGTFATVALTGGADTIITSGGCYRYQYKATDNVGNVSTASASADAKVDLTPPTTPSLLVTGLVDTAAAAGNVVYYRPGGSGQFTVTAASADSESGIASYTFPSAGAFTVLGSGASRTVSFSAAPAAPPAPLTVTATNRAGLTSPAASLTLVPDPTPPTVTVRCNGRPCLAAAYRKAVTVALSAADAQGSGVDTIRYTTNGTEPTRDRGIEYVRPFSVHTFTHLRVRAYDKAGNPSSPLALTVRSLADRLFFSAPARLVVRSGARYLFASVTSTHRGIASATMTGPDLKTPKRWSFILSPGRTIVQLQLPPHLARSGRYTIVWTVRAGTQKTRKTTVVAVG